MTEEIKEEKLNIICSQESLSNGIQTVQKAISSRGITLPIYSGILLEAEEDNKVHLFATDLEIGIDCYIPAQVIERGSIVLSNKIFSNLIRKLPGGNIEIQNKKEHTTTIKQGNSKYKILGFSAEEFSSFPEIGIKSKIKLSQKVLKGAIEQIIFAISKDENRAFLSGAYFSIKDNEFQITATDSHRLSTKKIIKTKGMEDCGVIVPYRALSELQKLLSGQDDVFVEINLDERQILFVLYPGEEKQGIRLVSRLIQGEFPNFEQIIPKDFKTEIKVETEEFMEKMERISIFTEEEVGMVKMQIKNDEIILNIESSNIGEAYEKVKCSKTGDDLDITFNSKYILDILKVINSENANIKFNGNLNPVIVVPEKDEGYLCVIMPIRSE